VVNPPAIISTPSRLSGLRHQAINPAAMYGTLIHSRSPIWMPLTPSFVNASASAPPAVAKPTAAIVRSTESLGG
jgi:hypothetical protein